MLKANAFLQCAAKELTEGIDLALTETPWLTDLCAAVAFLDSLVPLR